MKLNIYEKKEIIKTFEADAYDLPWGVVRDVTSAIDMDRIKSGNQEEIYGAVGMLLINSTDTVSELMKDMFDGLTDEDLNRASTPEIIDCLLDVVTYTVNRIMRNSNGKNLKSRMTAQ